MFLFLIIIDYVVFVFCPPATHIVRFTFIGCQAWYLGAVIVYSEW